LLNPLTIIGELTPVPVAPPGEAVTVYRVIGSLENPGELNVTDTLPLPAVTLSIVGTPGTPLGLADDPIIGISLFYHTSF
jgi:hypothetical protein